MLVAQSVQPAIYSGQCFLELLMQVKHHLVCVLLRLGLYCGSASLAFGPKGLGLARGFL